MKVLVAILLILAVASPVSAKTSASCSVSPNPVQVSAPLTITASASVGFLFDVIGPDGRSWSWPANAVGTVSYDWSAYIAGDWLVTVYAVKNHGAQALGACSFRAT